MTGLRAWIRWFDGWMSRRQGIFMFCDESECLLRLQFTRAPHAMPLDGAPIARGDPLLAIHLWNEHLLKVPAGGADFNWAAQTVHGYRHSLCLAARYVAQDPSLPAFRAVMGITSLFPPPVQGQSSHPMQRFGFTVIPYQSPLGKFVEFWENFYAWLLMWAYNPISAREGRLFKVRRSEIWMSRADFMARYAGRE